MVIFQTMYQVLPNLFILYASMFVKVSNFLYNITFSRGNFCIPSTASFLYIYICNRARVMVQGDAFGFILSWKASNPSNVSIFSHHFCSMAVPFKTHLQKRFVENHSHIRNRALLFFSCNQIIVSEIFWTQFTWIIFFYQKILTMVILHWTIFYRKKDLGSTLINSLSYLRVAVTLFYDKNHVTG